MAKLPPIQTLSECPHCGGDEFYVVQTYSGKGVYRRCFNGYRADNSHMYDGLNHKVGKRAFCGDCDKPVASWDDDADSGAYLKEHNRYA
ncbi:hypothetical protein ACXHIE_005838 [Pseudomonas aeruginosa]|uniref:hypothetical protein n=1 Tax=Pseudomonas aeruginosa TaxID=287 RepID=UPI000301A261|nr:hypothetical protein [Pseudomonas aeruginosa]EVT82570.1 hypothetical protein Z046_32345 [Pseudomonas aeruginosa VRFPA09]APB61018.1 hypothetical protein PA7790_06478 [Pseudomonas aeruginosa]EKW2948509.1 hypothetical protein [Pseudomonas aeruginosa]EMC8541960.1 hypothetical protein [Pseudomonas aeruginosa]EMC8549317.1 hypothetical protein [Pseudomonas aeruginosa]